MRLEICARSRWYRALMPCQRVPALLVGKGVPEGNELFRTSREEGNLKMGKNGGAKHKGREINGGLLHKVQRATAGDVAVRRARRGQTPWSWEGGKVHLGLQFIS